jgi:hypothetical protein
MRIRLVDKRTGRTIYDRRRLAQPDTLEIQGHPEQGLITLQLPPGRDPSTGKLQATRVNLTFGKPKEKEATPQSDPPKRDPAAKPRPPKR